MKSETNKLKVVIDTNVWVSAIVSGGRPRKILELFIEESLLVVISEELLSELRRKITQKFPLNIPRLYLLEKSLREDAAMMSLGARSIHVSRDPDDDKVIETALLGRCDYVVSGDSDLLELGHYENIQFVAPAKFLEIVSNRTKQ